MREQEASETRFCRSGLECLSVVAIPHPLRGFGISETQRSCWNKVLPARRHHLVRRKRPYKRAPLVVQLPGVVQVLSAVLVGDCYCRHGMSGLGERRIKGVLVAAEVVIRTNRPG